MTIVFLPKNKLSMQETAQRFIDFVDHCPLPFQFCDHVRGILTSNGYTELDEKTEWKEIPKKGFFFRDGRALLAWNNGGLKSGIIVGTHCDSPCFKLKPNFAVSGMYPQVSVAKYGGGIWKTWFDRNLRLAGRIYQSKEDGSIVSHNFDSKEGVAVIPTAVGEDKEETFRPIFGADPNLSLSGYISQLTNIPKEEIQNFEIGFVDAQKPAVVGTKGEFIAAQRIDNLGSTFSALEAFLKSEPKETLNILVVFDHEEIGSNTLAGAKSDLLPTFLKRIIPQEEYTAFIARSLVVSSDNAHAWHPNFQEKHEQNHRPLLGGGPVVKRSPAAAYATDMASLYPLKKAAELANVPLQMMLNRNDIPSGSTIGPHVSSGLGIATVDIGQPQLAMHSIRELVAVADLDLLTNLLVSIYNNYEQCRLQL